MATYAFIADVHLGNHRSFAGQIVNGLNERCQQGLHALDAAITLASRAGALYFVCLGDLFDNDRPLPQLLHAVQQLMSGRGMRFVLLAGNHEQRTVNPWDHALAPLEPVATVVDAPRRIESLLCLPYCAEPLAALESADASEAEILCLHAGIETEHTPGYLRDSPGSVKRHELEQWMDRNDVSMCVSGDWHERHEWESIVQHGALVPTGFDNVGLDYGYVTVVDTDNGNVEVCQVPGPRFLDVSLSRMRSEEWEQQCASLSSAGHSLYVRCSATPDQVATATDLLDQLVTMATIRRGQVVVDVADSHERLRAAVNATRSEQTLHESVARYISERCPEALRSAVLDRTLTYLRGAVCA